LISELYEYIQSVYLFRAVLSVFANPRSPTFNVTTKGSAISKDSLSELAAPYFVIFLILAATMVMIGWRWMHEPDIRSLITVVGVWNLLNLVIAGLAIGVVIERFERRRMPRVEGKAIKAALALGNDVGPAVITDVSGGGLRVRTTGTLSNTKAREGLIKVLLPHAPGSTEAEDLTVAVRLSYAGRDEGGRYLGLSFDDDGRDRYRLIAALQFADIGKIEAQRVARRRRRFMPLALVRLAILSIVQSLRGVGFAVFRRGSSKRSGDRPASN
jgi:cellulose synthase (UDP-forming)